MKRLYEYEYILLEVLKIYKNFNIQFVIIKTKYNDELLDKNKDDFLCQYLFISFIQQVVSCQLISNDKYRDRLMYLNNYKNMEIILYNYNLKSNIISKIMKSYEIDQSIINDMILKYKHYQRCSIPKNRLHLIIK